MDYTMKKQSGSLAATDLTFGCIFVVHDSNLLHLLKHKLLVQCLLTWSKSRTELGMARPTARTWSFRQSLPSFHIKYTKVSKVFKTILFKNYIISIKKTDSYCRWEKGRENEVQNHLHLKLEDSDKLTERKNANKQQQYLTSQNRKSMF